jgi:hypothetical protein
MGFREIEKEFVFICAFAVSHDRFELAPCFFYRTRASKPYSQIVDYLFKLNFHFSPLSHTSPQPLQRCLHFLQIASHELRSCKRMPEAATGRCCFGREVSTGPTEERIMYLRGGLEIQGSMQAAEELRKRSLKGCKQAGRHKKRPALNFSIKRISHFAATPLPSALPLQVLAGDDDL